ncbi:hypothetical protein EYV94_00950 [Puteibacter caeruleilacunae]|nr:hypothetical protein EYV94_00950 [Puteibacter caeruleilacunae]
MEAQILSDQIDNKNESPVIGVFATGDPRIDQDSRRRCQYIIQKVAKELAGKITLPFSGEVEIVYSNVLVDGESQADFVAGQFKKAGVNILVGVPDTWAFPQPSLMSLMAHFPSNTPLNLTCGNSATKPGVVLTHAASGAFAQSGRLMHINVGKWEDDGLEPAISKRTITDLIDWCYAASVAQGLRGKRILVFGHDSMGMETALAHVIPTRNTFGVEITRLDMKLLADMLTKESYDKDELKRLRHWIDEHTKGRQDIHTPEQDEKFNTSLAMYLIVRDLMKSYNAVGGGFMSQLEWGSDYRGIPLPVADVMESLFNSSFDHNGPKVPVPFATEADVQAILTMLFMSGLSGGNAPLFMDLRKVWESDEITELAKQNKVEISGDEDWLKKGFVDGNNSGSASFDWAGLPGTQSDELMKNVSFYQADNYYFPGGGNSVHFLSPGGIEGIAGRLAYSSLSGMFTMLWDEAETIELPDDLAEAVMRKSDYTWPHTLFTSKHASMYEFKHCVPANHIHLIWGLPTARLQFWMDMTNVLSATPWQEMEYAREGVDRPIPLLYVLNGGENNAKIALNK